MKFNENYQDHYQTFIPANSNFQIAHVTSSSAEMISPYQHKLNLISNKAAEVKSLLFEEGLFTRTMNEFSRKQVIIDLLNKNIQIKEYEVLIV